MRDVNRIDAVLKSIRKIWAKYPDLRLGQLICNVIKDPALYYVEDPELVKDLAEYYGVDLSDGNDTKKQAQ